MSVQQKGRSKHKIEVWNSSQCVLPTFKELKLIDIECITSIAPEHGKSIELLARHLPKANLSPNLARMARA